MSDALAAEVLARLGRVLPPDDGPYPLHEPAIGGNAWAYVKDCLDTGWVSSVGGYVDRFEAAVAEATGAEAAIATVNGTAALHVCLQLAGVAPGDEVLVPALTFVATANVVRYCGAVPHFVEAETTSLGVDAAALEAYLGEIARPGAGGWVNRRTGRRLSALIVMHCCGHAADLDALAAVAEAFGLALLQPTSPLRQPEDVEGALQMLRERDAEFVVSVAAAKPIAWHHVIGRDARLAPATDVAPQVAASNRQDLPPTVTLNGAIYLFDVETLRLRRSWFGPRTYGYPMSAERSIDIDTEADLRVAEALIASGASWQSGPLMPEPSIMVH